jgi:hypothetical protein
MKDSDAFIGILILIAILLFAAYSNGSLATTTTTTTRTTTSQPTVRTTTVVPTVAPTETPRERTTTPAGVRTNIPGGPLSSCPGWVIGEGTGGHDVEALTLKVYYSPVAGGRNCAVAIKGGAIGSESRIAVSLQFTGYTGTSWPSYAYHTTSRPAWRSGAVYLNDTNRRCVDATAIYRSTPSAKPRTVHVRKIGCR